jgi:hypothetical protein
VVPEEKSKQTRIREGVIGVLERVGLEGRIGQIGEEGFESIGLCFSITKETFRFHSATCSCNAELRGAVTLSRIFSQTRISMDFPKIH